MELVTRFKARGSRLVVLAAAVWIGIGTATAKDNLINRILGSPSDGPAATSDAAAVAEDAATLSDGVQMRQPGRFEIHVQDLDLRQVLQLLSTQGRRNIVATKEVTGTVTADLYDVTFKEALDAVMNATGNVYIGEGNFIYVYTPQQKAAIEAAQRKMGVEIFRLYYVTAEDARTLLEPAISTDGSISITPASQVGIESSDTDAGGDDYASNDVLVVRDYEDVLEKIRDIVKEIDIRPDQVLIEATILSARLTEDNDLGFNFAALAGINFEELDSSAVNFGNMTAGTISNTLGNFDQLPAAQVRTDFPTVANGLSVGFASNGISFFISALDAVTDLTVLANPKLVVLNKQRGEVLVGDKRGYRTTTVTETTATETVEFLETGIALIVRPFILKDGSIRMEIHPEDSDGSVIDGLPNEQTTEVTTSVIIRDGRTLVIGGLFREEIGTGVNQIPLLGDVPLVGPIFRSTTDDVERREVIVLITPHIIKQDVDEGVSEQMKDDVERYHIGARKGLKWWGRVPMAQSFLRKGRSELRAGNEDAAMWYIDMALALEPQMEEAIRLKEHLTEQAYWADQAKISTIRWVIQRMVMQDLGLPFERIVTPDKPRDAVDVAPEVRKALGITERYEDPLPSRFEPSVTGPMTMPHPAGEDSSADTSDANADANEDEEPIQPLSALYSDDSPAEAVESVIEVTADAQQATTQPVTQADSVEVPSAKTESSSEVIVEALEATSQPVADADSDDQTAEADDSSHSAAAEPVQSTTQPTEVVVRPEFF